MSALSPTVSIRLPPETRARLDKAVARTRRSRSFLMVSALERHLKDLESEDAPAEAGRRLSTLLSLGGAGVGASRPRDTADIDQHIRWLRDHG